MWWQTAIGVAIGLSTLWLLLLISLWRLTPNRTSLQEATRILPDVLRLIHRLQRDRSIAIGIRIRLWLLIAYLALPIDLVPDFIPVLGYADDAILIVAVLRSVIRGAGEEAIERHWPGSPSGLHALNSILNRHS